MVTKKLLRKNGGNMEVQRNRYTDKDIGKEAGKYVNPATILIIDYDHVLSRRFCR